MNAARQRSEWAGRRRRLYDILEDPAAGGHASRLVDALLVILILLNVAAVMLETMPEVMAEYGVALGLFDIFSVVVFTIEYAARAWVSPESPLHRGMSPRRARLTHAITPMAIIDFLAIAPSYLSLLAALLFPGTQLIDFRVLRILRLLRFFKLVRYSNALRSLFNAFRNEWRALAAALVVMLTLMVSVASLMYLAERRVQPEFFGSIPQSMWWAVVTLTTVGYGDVVPVTALGKVIAAVTMIGGLAMFALPVGIIATAFAQEVHRREFIVTWGMVARVPLFAELNASEIAEIMKLLEAVTVAPGQRIVHRGDRASSMYFIAEGTVSIDVESGPVTLESGDFFGEMALLTKSRRIASATAVTRCNLLMLSAEDFSSLMERYDSIAKAVEEVARERLAADRVKRGGDIVASELGGGEDE
ncbi:MAG: ion transporter [Rhodobiaceae bacterium]|nr:ion transporter [Rhodobiaceae bacterium]MCC0055804.1 ion transporter [Rhodobiaceae bacterium]